LQVYNYRELEFIKLERFDIVMDINASTFCRNKPKYLQGVY